MTCLVDKDKRAVCFPARFSLLTLFDLDYFASLVEPTISADMMGETRLSTVGALHKVSALQSVMRSATITASTRYFLFW
jgi:hypothetical protein